MVSSGSFSFSMTPAVVVRLLVWSQWMSFAAVYFPGAC
jgi:hypothetical protein